MKKRTSVIFTLGAAVLLSTYVYLHFHPGLLSRPEIGSSRGEMMNWLDRNGYSVLEIKTAGKNLFEAEQETERDPEMLRRFAARDQNGTLLSIGRLYREQSLCGAGQYFVFWRFDVQEKTVAEIYYDDKYCHIQSKYRGFRKWEMAQ